MAGHFLTDVLADLLPRELRRIDGGLDCNAIVFGRFLGRADHGGADRLQNPLLGVFALNSPDGEKRPERVKEVLVEGIPFGIRLEPLDAAGVPKVGPEVFAIGIGSVDPADCNGAGGLER